MSIQNKDDNWNIMIMQRYTNYLIYATCGGQFKLPIVNVDCRRYIYLLLQPHQNLHNPFSCMAVPQWRDATFLPLAGEEGV